MDSIITKRALYATQSNAKLQSNGLRYFNFYGQLAPWKFGILVKCVRDGEGYHSIDDLFAKELTPVQLTSSTPEEIDKLVLKMAGWVNLDFGRGFGMHCPDQNCVAWAGQADTHRPIAMYEYNGEVRFVAHPQIKLMIQWYKTV
jgi:hypothetical protein